MSEFYPYLGMTPSSNTVTCRTLRNRPGTCAAISKYNPQISGRVARVRFAYMSGCKRFIRLRRMTRTMLLSRGALNQMIKSAETNAGQTRAENCWASRAKCPGAQLPGGNRPWRSLPQWTLGSTDLLTCLVVSSPLKLWWSALPALACRPLPLASSYSFEQYERRPI